MPELSEGQPIFEHPLNRVTDKIAAFYASEAPVIVNALGDKQMCIVTGPQRNGKSSNLLPSLESQFKDLGKQVVVAHPMNLFAFGDLPIVAIDTDLIPQVEEGKQGVVIIDEAGGILAHDPKNVPNYITGVIAALQERGYTQLIPVISHDIDVSTEGLQNVTDTWKAAIHQEGEEIQVVEVPRKLLSKVLAEEFVRARGEMQHTSEDAVQFILNHVPYNVFVLDCISGAKDLEATKKVIRSNIENFRGILTKEEITQLRLAVNE